MDVLSKMEKMGKDSKDIAILTVTIHANPIADQM